MLAVIKFTLSIILLFLFHGALHACICGIEDLNQTTFKRYDFVAYVKFTKTQEFNGPDKGGYRSIRPDRIVHFETLALYRGEPATTAVENDHDSSCGTFITPGQEWLLFGILDRNGIIHIHGCTPSTEFRNPQGERILFYGYPSRAKNWLDSLCQLTPSTLALTGPDTLRRYFPDGKLSETTAYLNGQRHGPSRHYYATGQLMDDRYYVNGIPVGLRHHYLANGKLDFELEFDPQGNLLRELQMPDQYRTYRCETLYQPDSGWETEYCYRKNEQLYSVRKHYYYMLREAKYYSTKGQLIHHVRYDEDWIETVVVDSLRW